MVRVLSVHKLAVRLPPILKVKQHGSGSVLTTFSNSLQSDATAYGSAHGTVSVTVEGTFKKAELPTLGGVVARQFIVVRILP
jgi:hypothetical protein